MIEYYFEIEHGPELRFQVKLDRTGPLGSTEESPAFWTALDYHRCDVCPLRLVGTGQHCPPAIELQEIIKSFSPIVSYHQAFVRVVTPEREFSRRCDVQVGLNSLLGVVMATSGCPILSHLRPLAHFHLPFATAEETVFRTVGAYLLRQYLLMKEGGTPDFELRGLEQLYEQLVSVNTCFLQRIRAASAKDANLNAVIRLDSFSLIVLFSLKDGLAHEKLRYFSGLFQRGQEAVVA
jgi:hypothetical protein